MPVWITVATFYLPNELAPIKARLEALGIVCRVVEESSQYSGISQTGLHLQVEEQHQQMALKILENADYVPKKPAMGPAYIRRFEKISGNIPYLKKMSLEIRFIVLATVLLLIVVPIVYKVQMRDRTKDQLISGQWCITQVIHQQKEVQYINPEVFSVGGLCRENITFHQGGKMVFSELHVLEFGASWSAYNGVLTIYQADTLGSIYNGNYTIDWGKEQMVLTSDQTTIYARKEYFD